MSEKNKCTINTSLSNQIKLLEAEVKSLQTNLEKERSEKKIMQEAHKSEVRALQKELKDLKELVKQLSKNMEIQAKGDVFVEVPKEQSPAPKTQGKGFFRRYGGGLLKAGLVVGIATAGVLNLGCLVSHLDRNMYSLTAYACEKIGTYIAPSPS